MNRDFDSFPNVDPELLFATLTAEGERIYSNGAWDRYLGAGAPWSRLPDEDQERAGDYVREAGSGSLVTSQFFLVRPPDRDEPIAVLLNFLPVRLPSEGGVPQVGAVAITGEVLQEPNTWTQSQTQRNRLETLGRMTMGIAHDFNNLLSGILGYTELLKTYAADDRDSRIREPLHTIEQAALDGAALIRKIQQYIRQEKQTHFEPVDLASLVRDCIALTRPYWYNEPRRKGIAIEVNQRFAPLPPIMGAPTELREVFINLMLNAVQAMPQGGTITIVLGEGTDGSAFIEVTDTGIGMPEHVRARIFEPLFTTKGERGTGMGLAVSYGIIQEHEGTVDVTSQPGEGTCFRLVFPPAEEPVTTTAPQDDDGARQSARILVVDDEKMVRSILVKLLSLKGHDVHDVASGAEALTLVEDEAFDLVFTDLGMPEMNGRQLAQALRRRFPALPIVLLTGDTEVGEADHNVDVVVGKPFQIDELERVIQRLL